MAVPSIDGVINLEEIGRGGFGVVYRGSETEFDRDVAVKVLLPSLDDRTRKRFERERRAMGAVSGHPNIVTVYRGGRTPADQPYLVMEYLSGGSLSERLASIGPLDWRAAGDIGAKLADALHEAHKAGILHRDVKPGNIFLTSDSEPKLGDFGIARLDDGNDSRSGSITASIAHAAPEIIDGQRGDERSDLYSLASTIYALAMGTAPFARDPDQGLARLLARITNEVPPPLHFESAANEFEAVLLRALSKQPTERQQTVAEFGNQLRRSITKATPPPAAAAVAAPVTASPLAAAVPAPAQPIPAPGEPVNRSSPGQLLGLAVLALVIAGFGGWAVARAAFGSGETATTVQQATAVPEATAAPLPTDAPLPTATVAPTSTTIPTAVPPATPAPEPTSTDGIFGGGRIPFGFSSVVDPTGTIRVNVPSVWLQERSTVDDIAELDQNVRAMAVGGSFADLSGDPEFWDLTKSGVYIFVGRVSGPAAGPDDVLEPEGVLDGALEQWPTCDRGERSQILLQDGNAAFQILECDRGDGESSGVVVMGMALRDEPTVAATVTIQFADKDDLESLDEILESIEINPAGIP